MAIAIDDAGASSGGTAQPDADASSGGTAADATSSGDAARCRASGTGPAVASTPTLYASNFSNGAIAPYAICTTESPNYGRATTVKGDPAIEFFWTQVGYDGTRMKRGAEACSNLAFYKEGWYGFRFYLPSPGFPVDKTDGIAQLFALGGCSSWAGMLQVHGNALWFVHRGDCAPTGAAQAELLADIPRNVWNPIVIHFVVSHQSAGTIEIWAGDAVCASGAPTYRKTGINFAFGAWTGDNLTATAGNNIGLKFGMYNFDDGNYTAGETRTIYYDNVSQLVGNPPNAWTVVDPTQ